jgi:2-oxoisovalerate dehydrogenase E2 component (dihydrolipoyl transacylase)
VSDNHVKAFLVPDLGEGLEEATMICWNVAVGDDIELNQTLCSLETAKAEVEIPSPYAGRIVELRGGEGDALDVGSLLVRIDTQPGSDPDAPPLQTPLPERVQHPPAPDAGSADHVKAFLVPDLGEGLEEATIVCWNAAVGDDIELNQTLCSLETAKAEVEIPSPYAGRVMELFGGEGDVVEVGSLLTRIDTRLGATADLPPRETPPGDDRLPEGAQARARQIQNGAAPRSDDAACGRTPVLVGYGTDDAIDASRRSAKSRNTSAPAQTEAPPEPVGSRPRAAPPVRKLAAELLVDLAELEPGSGAGGIITREDVLLAAREASAGPPESRLERSHSVLPVRGVQAKMAERMALSHREIPDCHASVTVDCSGLLKLRDRFREVAGDDGNKATVFVLTLRLLIVALMRNKIFNSTWVDSPDGPQVHTHHTVNLGFGVATERGLLVPVVADAQSKTTIELAGRVADLIRGAREARLKPTELQGSTFTVSNFGALGLDEGVPVINYPEAAILGMGSVQPRAVVVDSAVVARPTMTLTCAFDHRIADGAQVAQFLCTTRELLESPEMALFDL